MSPPSGQRRRAFVAGLPNPRNPLPDDASTLNDVVRGARNARLPEPGGWAYVPWIGPAWETAYDLQEGDYAGAAFNAAMLAAEFTPAAPLRRVGKIVSAFKKGKRAPMLARDATQRVRMRNFVKREGTHEGRDFEVHHTLPFTNFGPVRAASRHAEGLLRNHPMFLKILDKATHRRLTGRYLDPDTQKVLEPFNAAQRAWHGTNALQKTTALAAGGMAVDEGQNLRRRSEGAAVPMAGQDERRRSGGGRPVFDPDRPIDVKRTEQGFIISNRKR